MNLSQYYQPGFDPERPLEVGEGYTGTIQTCDNKVNENTGNRFISGSIEVAGGPPQKNGTSPAGRLTFFRVNIPKDRSAYNSDRGYQMQVQAFRRFIDQLGRPDNLPEDGPIGDAIGIPVSFSLISEPNDQNPNKPYIKVEFDIIG